jgi:7-cyano-7-deazaguanine synthase
VWVPNRNGVLISIASAWAESLGATRVIVGFNAEEAKTFPGNTSRFVDASNRALSDSTSNGVQVHAPTGEWSKAQIVQYAREKDWPLELVWSCYEDEDVPCEKCESCRRFERALDSADAREWLNARREKWRS